MSVVLLFFVARLFALVVLKLMLFVAGFELFALSALSEIEAPSFVFVLNEIVDVGSLALVFPAGLARLPMEPDGVVAGAAGAAASVP